MKQKIMKAAVLILVPLWGICACKPAPLLNSTPIPVPTVNITPQDVTSEPKTTPTPAPSAVVPVSAEEAFYVDASWTIGVPDYHVQHLDTHTPVGYSINNGSSTEYDIAVIPPTYGDRRAEPVFNILGGVFTESNVKGVIIDTPNLERMKDYGLFNHCPNLEFVWFKDMGKVEYMDNRIADKCPNLRFVVIGDGIKSVDMRIALRLKAIYVPASVVECSLPDGIRLRDCTIYGEAGSYVESWAQEYGFAFVAVDEPPLSNIVLPTQSQ